MNVEIGTEAPIFLFWEYLFRNFGILSLQCRLMNPDWQTVTDPVFLNLIFTCLIIDNSQ
jgi:hypothetical protein